MCDPTIQTEIEQITLQKVQAGESFTAYDITKAVRAKVGRATPVAHSDVRQEVHSFFHNTNPANYTRTLCNMPSLPAGQDQPWVYHQSGADLSAYGLVSHDGDSVVVPSVLSFVPLPDSDDAEDDNDDGAGKQPNGSYKADGRATLCVPAKMVRGLGLLQNNECFAFADPLSSTLLLLKDRNPQGFGLLTYLSSYTVDQYANVRITQSALQRAGIGGQYYDVVGDGDKIVVKLFAN